MPSPSNNSLVKCENPHYINGEPAWNITLSNGNVHTSVTQCDISLALGKLYQLEKISLYDRYIDIVRHCHILWYNEFHTAF